MKFFIILSVVLMWQSQSFADGTKKAKRLKSIKVFVLANYQDAIEQTIKKMSSKCTLKQYQVGYTLDKPRSIWAYAIEKGKGRNVEHFTDLTEKLMENREQAFAVFLELVERGKC